MDDVRPYLWESAVSIVPLRIGGGTRLKIYEAMAAKIPVVSTTVGAEGLDIRDGENIAIADSPRISPIAAWRCWPIPMPGVAWPRTRGKWLLHVILGK